MGYTNIWILVCILIQTKANDYVFPQNEFVYSIERDALLEAELRLQGSNTDLTEDEQIVDHYLKYLKWKEFERTRDTGFLPSRPIEETLDDITSSEVYQVLQSFPKGGLLHTHENHQLSKKILFDIVWESEDFQHLYILPENHTEDPWKIDFFINPPEDEGWLRVEEHQDYYTKERLYQHHVLINILDEDAMKYPTDTKKRWDLMNTLWMKGSSHIIANLPIKIKHMEELYKHSLNDGVIYTETRKHLGSGDELIYVLDNSPQYSATNGKKYLDTDGSYDVNVTLAVMANISAQYPEFVGHKRIMYTQRQQPHETVKTDMERTLMLHELYPNHVIGYDIVGHEDAGNSHLYYVAEFINSYNQETGQSNLDFFFHTSETKWSVDLSASDLVNDDPVGAAQNIYEAVLLGAKRVGHGTGYFKHPHLLSILEERQVAIEVCPVSGMILGYFPDLRSHPAILYFRRGGHLVLGSDDAGSFGFEHFTVDWYDVFMSWGLDLKDLRQLALNSLNYSAMTENEKQDAIDNKWLPQWNKYIQTTKELACQANLTEEEPTFARILPRHGPAEGETPVHVFGRHFERGICNEGQMKCLFGEVEAPEVHYISNQHILCVAPERSVFLKVYSDSRIIYSAVKDLFEVPVKISFDGVIFDTNENYTYDNSIAPTTIPLTSTIPPDNNSAHTITSSIVLINSVFIILSHNFLWK